MDSELSKQVGGTHYQTLKIQPMEYITKNALTWAEGEVIKYVSRHRSKGGKTDIEKAIHILKYLLEAYDNVT